MRTKLHALWHKRKKRRERRPSQIEQLEDRRMLFSDWQNPSNHYDVNHDSVVTPLDVLLGINYLGESNSPVLPQRVNASDPYYDVNGDRSVSPVDILQVINYLNGAGHDSATVDTKGFVSLPLKALPGNATQRVEVNVTSLLDSGVSSQTLATQTVDFCVNLL